MNLLILTQKIDRSDDILGFFHEWVRAFAAHYERVTVICLEKGEYDLPKNVSVLSLGKEHNSFFRRPKYVWCFYRFISRERKNYDSVFIHMNPEYVVLGGLLWRLWGKKTALWYNHKEGGLLARIGAFFANHVFYTSPHAFMARFKKARQMPAGIDTSRSEAHDAYNIPNIAHKILSLGRISPVKRVEAIIDALKILNEKGTAFSANIYGNPTPRDMLYYQEIRKRARPLEKKGLITFHKGIPNCETPVVFRAHGIFVNATSSGSLDKTILEAGYHGALPVICNESFRGFLPDEFFFTEGDSGDLAEKLAYTLSLSAAERSALRRALRRKVATEHGLDKLVEDVHAVL